jgi:hypothetical protein
MMRTVGFCDLFMAKLRVVRRGTAASAAEVLRNSQRVFMRGSGGGGVLWCFYHSKVMSLRRCRISSVMARSSASVGAW